MKYEIMQSGLDPKAILEGEKRRKSKLYMNE